MESLIFPLSKKEAEKKGQPKNSDINKNALFPKRLKELRTQKGINQQKLADDIGVTKSTISLYEQGDNVPDIKTFVKIADYYGVSYDYLLSGAKSQTREYYDIAEKTGLSDKAIKTLIDWCYRENGNSLTMTANALLENQSVLSAIARYLYFDLDSKSWLKPYTAVFRHKKSFGFYHKTDPEGKTVYPVDGDSEIQAIDNDVYRRLQMLEVQEELSDLLKSELEKEQQDNELSED